MSLIPAMVGLVAIVICGFTPFYTRQLKPFICSVLGIILTRLWAVLSLLKIQDIVARLIFLAPLIGIGFLAYYFIRMGWGPIELVRYCSGIVALWLPLGAVLYILFRAQVHDRVAKITLSAIASYALTTLAYFGLATIHLEWLFYAGQVIAIGWLVIYGTRNKLWPNVISHWLNWQKWDWALIILVGASLVVNIPYKTLYEDSPQKDGRTYALIQDHFYHTGLVYELAEHVPPRQTYIRAGTPERAYHHFSHLTTMLLARFTGQNDLLRAHVVYHYTIIEILMCLALYSIVKTLTASRGAGYVAVSMMYLLAFSWPRLAPSGLFERYFYFTVFPHVTSGLDPVALTSPQMYSGLVVAYGILLGSLLISTRAHEDQNVVGVLLVTGLMIAASLRFRIHVFLALLPGFLLASLDLWRNKRHAIYALTGVGVFVISLLLFLEMRSSVYLAGTSNVHLEYVGLSIFEKSWPFATEFDNWFAQTLPELPVRMVLREVAALISFVGLNMLGLPLLVAAHDYLASPPACREFRFFSILAFVGLGVSAVAATIISTDYDAYSVGGQLLLHTRWYIFPLMAVVTWEIYRSVQNRLNRPRIDWVSAGLFVIVVALTARLITPYSESVTGLRSMRIMFGLPEYGIPISEDKWLTLEYLHDHTPSKAVIITDDVADYFLLSGISGRAVYLENPGNPVDVQARSIYPNDDRLALIQKLWATSSETEFCQLLYSTPATYLLERTDNPLHVIRSGCLEQVWRSPQGEMVIWEINHWIDRRN